MRKLLVLLLVAGAAAIGAQSAFAYGNTALYQATESLNCNNPAFPICAPPPKGFGLGGTWQWWEFDAGFTGDATVTFCGHTQGSGGPGTAGAQHLNLDIEAWSFGPAQPGDVDFPGGINFYVDLATWTITGANAPPPFEAPYGDTGIPVIPGHYSFHPVPGVAGEVQVVAIPH